VVLFLLDSLYLLDKVVVFLGVATQLRPFLNQYQLVVHTEYF
jgi:hypothetical protein